MEEIKRHICVAIDDSEYALWAFERALQLLKEGDRVVLLHAVEIMETSILDPLHEPIDRVWNIEQRNKQKKLNETYSKICEESKIPNWSWISVEGPDAREIICQEIAKLNPLPSALVMGSRGLGPLKKLLLGSTSSYCCQHAPCPVWIVKQQPGRSKEGK